MPLLDHFHAPGDDVVKWDSLHSGWATYLASALNENWLTSHYLALEHTHLGPHVEIDVAALEGPEDQLGSSADEGSVATLPRTWAPPVATCTLAATFPDRFEVQVFAGRGGWYLVGAIELISPGNKDRAEDRRAFTAKCASYLHQGASVVIIDIVTNRRANLHNELIRLLNAPESALLPENAYLYAAAYRPVLRQGRPEIDVWTERLALGVALPTMPLRLTADTFVPVEFESAYWETCRRRRLI